MRTNYYTIHTTPTRIVNANVITQQFSKQTERFRFTAKVRFCGKQQRWLSEQSH